MVRLSLGFASVTIMLASFSHIAATEPALTFREKVGSLQILDGDQLLAEFVYRDAKILRPYFANLRTLSGTPVTRTHPPVARVDATDHDTMHPGVWLGFGALGGSDFWRNKGRVEQVRFLDPPQLKDHSLTFTTESQLISHSEKVAGKMLSRYEISLGANLWALSWSAELSPAAAELTFGDQEEMGFGVRVATPLTEQNGGIILNSAGSKSAAETWGKPALWCDYSGAIAGERIGVTIIPAEGNFRPSWWHNRNYGLMVANPFGRAAMKQGKPSEIRLKHGEKLQITFTAIVHQGDDYDPAAAYRKFRTPVPR